MTARQCIFSVVLVVTEICLAYFLLTPTELKMAGALALVLYAITILMGMIIFGLLFIWGIIQDMIQLP